MFDETMKLLGSLLLAATTSYAATSLFTQSTVSAHGSVCLAGGSDCVSFVVNAISTGTSSALAVQSMDYGLGRTVIAGGPRATATFNYLYAEGGGAYVQPVMGGPPQLAIGAAMSFMDTITIFGGSGVGYLWGSTRGCEIGCTVTRTIPASFEYGVPFQLGLRISAFNYSALYMSGRYLDLLVLDEPLSGGYPDGPWVTGYTYTSESGTAYPFIGGSIGGTHTPEPSTLWCSALALLALGVIRAALPAKRRP